MKINFYCIKTRILISQKGSTKIWVTPVHLLNRTLFTFMYVVPLVDLSSTAKTVLLIVLLFGRTAIINISFSHKVA